MSNSAEKKLKEICLNIAKINNSSSHVAELKKQIIKGRYFEQQSFKELIEIVSNQSVSNLKASEIYKLLKTIVNEGTGNKDFLITSIHNFICERKYRLDLLDELVDLGSFTEAPECRNPETIVYIAEQLLLIANSKDQRLSLYQNYEAIIRLHLFDEKLKLSVMNSVSRVIVKFIKDQKWIEIVELLKSTILNNISNQTFVVSSDEVFKDLLKIITWLTQFGHNVNQVTTFCLLFTETLAKVLNNNEYQKCCDVMSKVLKMCCNGAITEIGLKELHSVHFKSRKTTGESNWLQETVSLVVQLFRDHLQIFDKTADCFNAYHQLLVKFFHVIKFIKNKEGTIPCCADIKRHKIHNAIETILNLACHLVKANKFNSSVAHNVEYHVNYDEEICSSLKCKSKHIEMMKASTSIYNLVYQFTLRPPLLEDNIEHLDKYLKIMFKLYKNIPQEIKASKFDLSQILSIYGKPKNSSTALIHANGVASHLAYRRHFTTEETRKTKGFKHSLMRFMLTLRESAQLIGFESATEFISSDSFDDKKFFGDTCCIPKAEFILIEITSIFRFSVGQNHDLVEKLFLELTEETVDAPLLAEASQALTDSTLKLMKSKGHMEVFENVIKLLEDERNKGYKLDVSLALALNNYSMFYVGDNLVPRNQTKENVNQMIGKLQLQEELDQLRYLNESLRHFTDVVCYLMQNNEEFDKVLSITRVFSILRNIATQYFMRGIKYKDFEAFSLLWHLAGTQEDSSKEVLNIATFFIDHHMSLTDSTGNYIKLSNKLKPLSLEEILERANNTIDKKCLTNFEDQSASTQSYTLSYLLSLWVLLVKQKKKSSVTRWNQFKSLWESWKIPEQAPNRVTIHAKIYYCLMEVNLKRCLRNSDRFLSQGSTKILSVTKFDHEFACQFHQIYYRYNMEAINHSMNRMVDMDHYELAIQSLLHTVTKNRFCLKTLELLSLSIMRYLNMEKLERAKAQLQEITKLLRIREEILVESPYKDEIATTVLGFDFQIEKVRKQTVQPSSPIQCEISTRYEHDSELLCRKLESFVHRKSCNCELCKAPQLKFITFQVGCHYSRLMWLDSKWSISLKFNEFALDPWRMVCDKLRRIKDCEFLMINKVNFAIFSIRWLFQYADTLIRTNRFVEAEEIYEEANLMCTTNIPYYDCFKQALYCRKENLNHLQSEVTELTAEDLSFAEFIKKRPEKLKKSKQNSSQPAAYVDLSRDKSLVTAKAITKTAKKSRGSPPEELKPTLQLELGDKNLSSGSSNSLRLTRRRMI